MKFCLTSFTVSNKRKYAYKEKCQVIGISQEKKHSRVKEKNYSKKGFDIIFKKIFKQMDNEYLIKVEIISTIFSRIFCRHISKHTGTKEKCEAAFKSFRLWSNFFSATKSKCIYIYSKTCKTKSLATEKEKKPF